MTSTLSRIQQRLHELRDEFAQLPREPAVSPMGTPLDHQQFQLDGIVTWETEVRSMLEIALPPTHAVIRNWNTTYEKHCCGAPWVLQRRDVAASFFGILKGAINLIDNGMLTSVEQGAKAATVAELLDVADDFLTRDEKVAAAVLAGGALETHLRHLCDHHGVTWQGNGSIEAYNQAIGQERKAGNEIYSAGDQKQVTAWGDRRNKAAHEPTNFTVSKDVVDGMISGIRDFVARTTPGH